MAPVKKPQPSSVRQARKPSSGVSKSKSKSKDAVKRAPAKQVKTKRSSFTPSSTSQAAAVAAAKKKKKPVYTDAQLKLPTINGIVPANAAVKTGRGAGKKKNKVYVDDTESMMTILAMVNAEKEGVIESKVLKQRRLEEIREARVKEMEKRKEGRKDELEVVKKGLKRKAGEKEKGDKNGVKDVGEESRGHEVDGKRKKRKSVSFAS